MGLKKRYVVAVVGVAGSPAESQRSEVGSYRSDAAARQAGADEWRRILFVHAPHMDRYRVLIERDGSEVGDIPMPEVPADAAPGIFDETVTPLGIPLGAAGESLQDLTPDPEAAPGEVVEVVEVVGVMAEVDAVPAAAPTAAAVPEVEAVPAAAPTAAAVPEVEAVPAAAPTAAAVPEVEEPQVEIEALESTGEMAVVPVENLAPSDAAATGQHPVVSSGDVPAADTPTAADSSPDPVAPSPPAYAIEELPEGPVPEDIIARFAEAARGAEERAAERERERGS